MGFGGSVAGAITALKNNKALLGNRKRQSEIRKEWIQKEARKESNGFTLDELEFTKEAQKKIAAQLEIRKKEEQKLIGISLVLLALLLLLFWLIW